MKRKEHRHHISYTLYLQPTCLSKNATFGKEQSDLVNKSNSKNRLLFPLMIQCEVEKPITLFRSFRLRWHKCGSSACVFCFSFCAKFYMFMYPLFFLMPMTIFCFKPKLSSFHVRAHTHTHTSTGQLSSSFLTMLTISFIAYRCLIKARSFTFLLTANFAFS